MKKMERGDRSREEEHCSNNNVEEYSSTPKPSWKSCFMSLFRSNEGVDQPSASSRNNGLLDMGGGTNDPNRLATAHSRGFFIRPDNWLVLSLSLSLSMYL